jgi:hypothetical protein
MTITVRSLENILIYIILYILFISFSHVAYNFPRTTSSSRRVTPAPAARILWWLEVASDWRPSTSNTNSSMTWTSPWAAWQCRNGRKNWRSEKSGEMEYGRDIVWYCGYVVGNGIYYAIRLYPSGGNAGNEDFKVIVDLKMDGLRCVWGIWVRKPQKNAGTKQWKLGIRQENQ